MRRLRPAATRCDPAFAALFFPPWCSVLSAVLPWYSCLLVVCFTHTEVSFVGITEEQAREEAEAGGYEVRPCLCSVFVSLPCY